MDETSSYNSEKEIETRNNIENLTSYNENNYTSNYQSETLNNNYSQINQTEYESETNNFQTNKSEKIYDSFSDNNNSMINIHQTEISNPFSKNITNIQKVSLNDKISNYKNINNEDLETKISKAPIKQINNKIDKNQNKNEQKENIIISEKQIKQEIENKKDKSIISNINSEFEDENKNLSPIHAPNITKRIKTNYNESFLNDSIRSNNEEIVRSLNNFIQNTNKLDLFNSSKNKTINSLNISNNKNNNKSKNNLSLNVQNSSKINNEEISSLKKGALNEKITLLNLKDINISKSNDQEIDEMTIFKRTNRTNENPKIFLCPYCNKNVPLITSLLSKQISNNNSLEDIINTLCKCGNYSNNLSDYLNLYKKNINLQSENCYNKNHQPIKGIEYCSICKKYFCETCLQFHKDYLPDHNTSPYKIDNISYCFEHFNPIENYCENCKIGICNKCNNHKSHSIINLKQYWNKIYFYLPFKNNIECENYLLYHNQILEKEMKSFVDYIENFIKELKNIENNIKKEYEKCKKRREDESELIKYLFSNFLAFSNNYIQIKNMEQISFLCPSIFLCLEKDFIKEALEYIGYLKKNSIIEINENPKINKFEFQKLIKKYNQENIINQKKSKNIFKIFDTKGVYYGQFNQNKREGIGIQFFKNGDIFEGIWEKGTIIKGKISYFNGKTFEGEFKNGENDLGIKGNNNNENYQVCITERKNNDKGFIEKLIEKYKN